MVEHGESRQDSLRVGLCGAEVHAMLYLLAIRYGMVTYEEYELLPPEPPSCWPLWALVDIQGSALPST